MASLNEGTTEGAGSVTCAATDGEVSTGAAGVTANTTAAMGAVVNAGTGTATVVAITGAVSTVSDGAAGR